MLRIKLSKICSYIYHKHQEEDILYGSLENCRKQEEKAASEIWEVIKLNVHPRSQIKHVFSPETTEVIKTVNKEIEAAEKRRILELKKLKKRK